MTTYEQAIERLTNREVRKMFEFTDRERKGLSYENALTQGYLLDDRARERRIATIVARATLPNHARI